jgi:hypothetical protein
LRKGKVVKYLGKEFKPKFIPDNPMTENPYDLRDKKRISVPKEDTHQGVGLRELNGEVNEVDAKNLLGEDE